MSTPTRSGQAVRFVTTGEIGITTSEPRKHTQSIGVQFIGRHYAVWASLEKLEVIELAESSKPNGARATSASNMSVNDTAARLQAAMKAQEPSDQIWVGRADLERVLKYVDDVNAWRDDFVKQFGGKS